jgi:cell division protein FtsQ
MGSRRGSSMDTAVMDVPEETIESSTDWQDCAPAPAGAWKERVGSRYPQEDFWRIGSEESPYVPKRASMQGWGWRRWPRTTGGWVLWGSAVALALGLVATAAYTVRYYLLHDDRFIVTTSADIQIAGNEHLTRAQVLSVFGADLERNIFKAPLAERRADLERLPWVRHATVMRLLPNQLRIAIQERTPVAFVRQGTQIGLVDASGVLLDMPEQAAGDPKYSFPVLTGLNAGDPLSTRAARMEIYKRFMTELDAGSLAHGQKLTETLSEVDVSNPEDVKALITTDGTDVLVHFGDQDFLARYKSFEEHLPEWRQQYPKLASADMRYEDQIVLEMQKGANVPPAGDEAPANDAADDATPAAVPAPANSRSPSGMTTRKAAATTTAKAPTSQKRDVGHPGATAKAKPIATKAKPVASKPAVKATTQTTKTATKPAAGIAGGPQ